MLLIASGIFSAWSDEGCRVLSTNRTHTQCRCDHLTNFAILMDLHSTPLSSDNGMALSAITYVGCSVSIICLLLATVTFTFLRGIKVRARLDLSFFLSFFLSLLPESG